MEKRSGEELRGTEEEENVIRKYVRKKTTFNQKGKPI